MCLAIPALITEKKSDNLATAEILGVTPASPSKSSMPIMQKRQLNWLNSLRMLPYERLGGCGRHRLLGL